MLRQGQCDTDTVLQEDAVTQLTQIVDDLMNDIPVQIRTWKLWMQYIRQVRVLLLFIWVERTGNWDLHLYAVSEMIPILHAAAHLAYAKSAWPYLDTMKTLSEIMTEAQFRTLTEDGYFTIKSKDEF